jgi:cytochrome P450
LLIKYFHSGLLDGGGDKTGLIGEMTDGTALVSTMACSHRLSWVPSTRAVKWLLSVLQPNQGTDAFIRRSENLVRQRLNLQQEDRK